MPVADHLDLDVMGPFDQALHVERAIAECCHGLPPRRLHRACNLAVREHAMHALAAAARGRLDERRQAHPLDEGAQRFVRLIRWRLARDHRDAGALHEPPGFDLRAHLGDDLRGWTDEREPACSQASANAAFSERKPYPGWTASAPDARAASMRRGMLR